MDLDFCIILFTVIGYVINSDAVDFNAKETKPPHIIFILADDLGFNDCGFRGSAQIPTPNIDALAFSGVILNRYYVNPICTPSRSALMTGKYPIHTGMQHTVLFAAEPRGLPLTEKLLPQYLNTLGYSSHIAGKWHLGHFKNEYTPLFRGFRTHVGYWTGHHDYFDHTAVENPSWGLDIRNGLSVAYELHGKYTTDLITEESTRVIAAHNSSNPLFLYVAHAAVHSGNPYNPLPAPDSDVSKMRHIEDFNRRKYAAMLTKLDDSVGKIVQQLHKQNMLNDSIIIFSTDNGGPAEGFNLNHASNWPLRGVKNTLWEGGVRGAGLIWYPKINKLRRVADQTMHIVDWLPTLLSAIGADHILANSTAKLDGISIWNALTNDEVSPRRSILHNIDDIYGSAALTTGDWKVVKGTNYNGAWDGWYGPPGVRDPKMYMVNQLYKSLAGKAITDLKLMPSIGEIFYLRNATGVDCAVKMPYLKQGTTCKPLLEPCLFNVKDDPCERYNLAKRFHLCGIQNTEMKIYKVLLWMALALAAPTILVTQYPESTTQAKLGLVKTLPSVKGDGPIVTKPYDGNKIIFDEKQAIAEVIKVADKAVAAIKNWFG